MREILFRGKRTDNGEWVYGAFIPDATEPTHGDMVTWGFIRRHNKETGKMESVEVTRTTVGQYTGETDKNGVKIFEGDRVLTDEAGWIGYVTFGGGEFYVTDEHGGYARCCNWSDYEVLGNIHDAPEGEKGGGAWR